MDRYLDFTVEDFVWDSFFRQWVLSPTRETDDIWEEWLENHPESQDKIQQAKGIVLSLRLHEPEIGDPEIASIVKQTMGRIEAADKYPSFQEPLKSNSIHRFPWLRVAASVAFLLVASWIIYTFSARKVQKNIAISSPVSPPLSKEVEKWNATKKPMQVKLADGSKITLATNGRIRYANQFLSEKREVYLEGEAFFDIAKDSLRPFLVYSNGLVTKVLGTSFTIKAYGNSNEVTVEVSTGRVSVFPESDAAYKQKASGADLQGIVLRPNQKIIYSREEVRMVKTLVEKPQMVVAKAEIPAFEFEDTPASAVFDTIGKAYGIEILYDEALLKDCPLTATLDNQTLHEKLSIICKAVESSYEILDGQIIIHSKGCRN